MFFCTNKKPNLFIGVIIIVYFLVKKFSQKNLTSTLFSLDLSFSLVNPFCTDIKMYFHFFSTISYVFYTYLFYFNMHLFLLLYAFIFYLFMQAFIFSLILSHLADFFYIFIYLRMQPFLSTLSIVVFDAFMFFLLCKQLRF